MSGPYADMCRDLEATFGPGEPPRLFFAPGRVNLIGAHIDYSGGPVLTASVDLGTAVVVRRSPVGRWRLASLNLPERLDGPLHTLPPEPPASWLAYPLGVLAVLRGDGHELPPLDLLVSGSLPIAAGLSSSAALLVALAGGISALGELGLDRPALADVAYRAETGYVGVQVGRQDQIAAALGEPGHVLFIDFKTLAWETIPFPADRLSLVVIDSRTRRQLTAGNYNQRVAEARGALEKLRARIPHLTCLADLEEGELTRWGTLLTPLEHRRARHVVSEKARVLACREALRRGDVEGAGCLLSLSHHSSRLDYETSTEALDFLQGAALGSGVVFGARLTGGGFGGCVLALSRAGAEDRVRGTLAPAYERAFGLTPTVHVFRVGPGFHEIPRSAGA
ncbi:MAG: galactokinase [Planctomycetota bacterium]